jgi:NAD(P)H-dependent FMN reductase
MPNIIILSSSVRIGKKSPRVAVYFKNYIEQNKLATVELLDLDAYKFPIFDERLRFQKNPTEKMLEAAGKIKNADGVLIVTPEYNGGYPASLKNFIDLLYDEWYHKPIAIATVSAGAFGGSQVITSLQFSLWKIRALVATTVFPVPKVEDSFDENGIPKDKEGTDKRAAGFLKELLWMMEACEKMKK